MKMTYYKPVIALVISAGVLSSCKKYLDIPQPTNSITTATAFNTRGTIDGMMSSLYLNFWSAASFPVLVPSSEYLADNAYNPTTSISWWQTNNVSAVSPQFLPWGAAYKAVYMANTLLGGLPGAQAPGFSDADKAAYIAAVKTVRAYTYFQLVRCYGDVPLITSASVDSNKLRPRDNKNAVYALIEKDLQEAIPGLPAARGDRYYIRSKFIPEAILANVYLTEGKWAQAEAAASDIINSNQYELSAIQNVFLQSGRESILVLGYSLFLFPNSTKAATNSLNLLPQGDIQVALENFLPALSPDLLNSFEPGDLRKTNWVKLSNQGGYPNPENRMFCYKYKYNINTYTGAIPAGQEEDNVTIRLAEVYLIRAEARARQNNLTEAANDLNVIRTRAGLPNTIAATQTEMTEAVLRERRVELFFEGGASLVRPGTNR